LVGGLYAAKLIFEFLVLVGGRPGVRRLCEDRLILVTAPNANVALREANRQGRASEHKYRNNHGNPVHFRFVGVVDLLHLGVECQPNEVWHTTTERVRPMERRARLIPKAHELNAIRQEARLLGKRVIG